MSIEVLFYTQLLSILGYVAATFVLYRLLVSQKDAVIELLRQRNENLQAKISELETQSPDVLVDSLSRRVEIAKKEIETLAQDGELHTSEIAQKESDLSDLREKVAELGGLLKDTDLVCPECQAPLMRRDFHTIYGEVNGREAEADIMFTEYACGYSTSDDGRGPTSACCAHQPET